MCIVFLFIIIIIIIILNSTEQKIVTNKIKDK